MSRRASGIWRALRGDPFADPESLIRRVYAYIAYRIGPGQPAENAARDVFTQALESRRTERHTDLWLIDAARRDLDERFGPSKRDRGLVALHLVGLDTAQIAKLLGYRREAATVALGRALSRLRDEQELTWAEPDPEFVERLVDDIRAARQPSGRRRRALGLAVSAVALLAAVPAFGALVAGDDGNEETNALPKSNAPPPREQQKDAWRARRDARATPLAQERRADCDRLAERLEALPARHERAIARLIRRQAQERQDFFSGRGRWATRNPDSGPRAAKMLRERSAFEARLFREQETLLERLNRELRKLEARRKSCEG